MVAVLEGMTTFNIDSSRMKFDRHSVAQQSPEEVLFWSSSSLVTFDSGFLSVKSVAKKLSLPSYGSSLCWLAVASLPRLARVSPHGSSVSSRILPAPFRVSQALLASC